MHLKYNWGGGERGKGGKGGSVFIEGEGEGEGKEEEGRDRRTRMQDMRVKGERLGWRRTIEDH